MKKRIFCLLLLLCMLLPTAVACKKDGAADETAASTDAATAGGSDVATESETKDKYDVHDALGEIDLGGREITVGTCADPWFTGEFTVEGYTGEIVNDAVYTRNFNVENRLNIKLKNDVIEGNVYAPPDAVLKNVTTGLHVHDLLIAPVYTTIINTGKGCWKDLTQFSSLDLSQPYWSQWINEQLSVADHQFVASGAIALTFYRQTYVTLVNDTMLATKTDAPNLVEVVNDKKWTLEYQTTLAKQYHADDGDGVKEMDDTYGFITASYNGVNPYWSSCELPMLSKTQDGYYQYAMNKDRLSRATDQMIALFTDPATWCSDYRANFDEVSQKFAEGTALMATVMLSAVETAEVQNMANEYSILPIPKLDEDQDTYFSFVHDRFSVIAMPATSTATDADAFSVVMEALASESYRTVTQTYYEKALKGRYANAASVKMLDMITQNVYFDAGVAYVKLIENMPQHVRNIVDSAVKNGTGNTVSSSYNAEWEENCRTSIAELNDDLKKITAVS